MLPSNDNPTPSQNPGRRPSRLKTKPAGIDPAITPSIWIAIGSVTSACCTASCRPTSEAMTTCPDITAFISAWQQNSSQTFRFIGGPILRLASRKRQVNPPTKQASEMAPAAAGDLDRPAGFVAHRDSRFARAERADTGHGDACGLGCVPQRADTAGRNGEQQFVIIPAGEAGDQPILAGLPGRGRARNGTSVDLGPERPRRGRYAPGPAPARRRHPSRRRRSPTPASRAAAPAAGIAGAGGAWGRPGGRARPEGRARHRRWFR